MSSAPYPSLSQWIADHQPGRASVPPWAHPTRGLPALVRHEAVRQRLEGLIATTTAVQRAEWLTSGVWLGPRTFPKIYEDLLYTCRLLGTPIPPVIVGPTSSSRQVVIGTDDHPTLYLSGAFMDHAAPAERRFVLGRLVGQIAAHQVTWRSVHALTSPERDLRKLASRALGPAVDLVLSPIALALRATLARWVQLAEVSSDRAGLLTCEDVDVAKTTLIRMALLTPHEVDPEEAVQQGRRSTSPHGGARWAELLTDVPALHTRIEALDHFTRSVLWPTPLSDVPLTAEQLADVVQELMA